MMLNQYDQSRPPCWQTCPRFNPRTYYYVWPCSTCPHNLPIGCTDWKLGHTTFFANF